MEDVEWILHVPPWGFMKGINRMFCSVYKYCCASKTFPSGKLSPPCCCDVFFFFFFCKQEKQHIILHFINRRSVCDARCGAFSANVPQIVIQFRGAALKFILNVPTYDNWGASFFWRSAIGQKVWLVELDGVWEDMFVIHLASLKNTMVHNWNIRRPNSHAKFLLSLTEVQ